MREIFQITTLLLLFTSTQVQKGLSQEGTPRIFNHTKSEYHGSVTNWDIKAREDGSIVAANGNGLIMYNGKEWKSYPLPNRSLARSLCLDGDKVYVGGQDEVGYFDLSEGNPQFRSLRNQIDPQHLPIEDVWNIQVFGERVYFLSKNTIYIIDGQESSVIHTGNPIHSLIATDSKLYFVDMVKGVCMISNTDYSPAENLTELPGGSISALCSLGEDVAAITFGNQIYISNGKTYHLFVNNIQPYFDRNIVQTMQKSSDAIAIGTRYGGVAVMNLDGSLRYTVTKKDGLQNDAINKLAFDTHQNLWIASANGIDNVLVNAKQMQIYPDGDLEGSVYDILEHEGYMYFATSNGLYYQDLRAKGMDRQTFHLVDNTKGQVWGLDNVLGDLLMAHGEGAFIIEKDKARKISPGIGAWKFTPLPDGQHMFVGTYFGVDLYERRNDEWQYVKIYDKPKESSRIMLNGKGNNLWVSHPYRGVYQLVIDKDFNLINTHHYYGQKGLPSSQLNYIFEVNGKMIVAAESGVYEYDQIRDRFVPHEWLSELLPQGINLRNIQSDKEGNLWYITTQEVCKFEFSGEDHIKTCYPELVGKFVGGFENLYLHSSQTVYACNDQGALKYDISPMDSAMVINAKLLTLNTNDSTYHFTNNTLENLEVTHDINSFRFDFAADWARPDVEYSYYLEGEDERWSAWSSVNSKEYTKLSPGDYIFQVKAKLANGLTSETSSYSFSIKPPWYKTKLAILLYFILFMLTIVSLLHIPRRKYKREKAILEGEKQQTEEELEKLKIEKMQNEIDLQNSALASSTLHLVQKNTTLHKVKSDIESIKMKVKDVEVKKQLKKVLSALSDDIRLEQEWHSFEIHFDKVHSDFLKRLKAEHPNLSPKDLKLSAYLRMNLNTKEIAPLLNISVRGVEISRYRLRKKLELSTDTNLSEWMLSF